MEKYILRIYKINFKICFKLNTYNSLKISSSQVLINSNSITERWYRLLAVNDIKVTYSRNCLQKQELLRKRTYMGG